MVAKLIEDTVIQPSFSGRL